ncbi:MAG: type VI secretion system baseplate subunit TssE [Deltaproteobacteria bacterium]|nr:MAG: type VI secretion system baseplate subunit TssE [Deltaproteobacteria bacterium]
MVALSQMDKLQPCLLDRLTDDEPGNIKEGRAQRVMSLQRYRQAVLRDIAWLLNTHANSKTSGLDAFAEIPSSVLNYGVQNVAGMTPSSLDSDEMRYRIIEALRRFEPRVIPNSVSIRIIVDPEEMSNRSIRFEILGDLWAQPVPESLFIRTDLDLETGKCSLRRG